MEIFELKRKQNLKNFRRMNGTEQYIGWGNSGSEIQTLYAHSQTSLLASNINIYFKIIYIYINKLTQEYMCIEPRKVYELLKSQL